MAGPSAVESGDHAQESLLTPEMATGSDSAARSRDPGARRPSPMNLGSQEHVADPERTPRLHDLPKIISTLPTPGRLPPGQQAANSAADTPAEESDYFLLQPSSLASASTIESETTEDPHTPSAASASTSTSPSTSVPYPVAHSITKGKQVDQSSIQQPSEPSMTEVAGLGTSASVGKKISAIAANRSPPAPIQTRSTPRYPNQSYSALQHQSAHGLFVPRSAPGPQRSLTLHPVSRNTSDQVSINAPFPYESGSRTAGNSPAVTPRLFEPLSARTPATAYSTGQFSYLNTLQDKQPIETNIADIDVDPVSGRKIINDYEIMGELGRGMYGKVKLGRNLKTGDFVAIKIVERFPKRRRLGKAGKAEDKVKREVAILKKARHPNIVALLEVIDDPARRKVYIVLERVDLGEISWRADPIYAKEIALIEYRRFERESKGIIVDPVAEQEDQAILELARVRRTKAARARIKTLRRQDTGAWSIETAGGIYDDSDLDDSTRGSTSTESGVPAKGHGSPTLSRRSSASAASFAHSARSRSPRLTRKLSLNTDISHPSLQRQESIDPLEGSTFGSFSESSPEMSARAGSTASMVSLGAPGLSSEPLHEDNVLQSHSNQSDNNLMQRAMKIQASTEILPDLQFVPTMSINAARLAFRDTLLGLQYLHYHGVIHRDIKPPNLLQTKDHRIKISDFGVSYLGRPTHEEPSDNQSESDTQDFDEAKELAKTVGTPAFYAPELCYTDGDDDQPPVTKAIDVWALGVTLYCMLFARVPIAESSEYVTMRRIADERIHIPLKRLLPLGPQTSSFDIIHPPIPGTRNPTALEYEELDETLLDLLRRLLTKDPRDRISLEEVRHHPWVVADITEKERWLDETDPVVQARGKKIEVTTEDVEQSVQSVTFVNRIRSGIKKAVAAGFGLARSNSARKKEAASAASTGSTPVSATPATPASISGASSAFDIRKIGARGDDTIVSALKASREGEHPLSQSVTASPDQPDSTFSAQMSSRLDDPQTPLDHLRPVEDKTATTSSARTIRPTDAGLQSFRATSRSGSPSPAHSLDSPSGFSAGILGGASRLLKSVRGRSRPRHGPDSRERSSSRASASESSDGRAVASLAISTASAAGEIDGPEALKDTSTPSTSASQSLSSSPAIPNVPSFTGHHYSRHHDERAHFSRQSSMSFTGHYNTGSKTHSRSSSLLRNMSTDEDLIAPPAGDDILHHRLAEVHASQRPLPSASRSSSSVARAGSISSVPPEDLPMRSRRDHATQHSFSSMAPSIMPSLETSPASAPPSTLPLITPSASNEGMAFGHPTIPTVLSQELSDPTVQANQSAKLDDSPVLNTPQTDRRIISPAVVDEDEGYDPDPATDFDHEASSSDSSDDDDDGLQMMGRQPGATATGNGHQGSRGRNTHLLTTTNSSLGSSRHRERRGTAGSAYSKKSSRSGSNNTMRRVVSSPVDAEAEQKSSSAKP